MNARAIRQVRIWKEFISGVTRENMVERAHWFAEQGHDTFENTATRIGIALAGCWFKNEKGKPIFDCSKLAEADAIRDQILATK